MAFILQFSGGITNEATLSMLGLGPFQTVSLGVMLHWALLWEAVRTGAWWAFLPPVVFDYHVVLAYVDQCRPRRSIQPEIEEELMKNLLKAQDLKHIIV